MLRSKPLERGVHLEFEPEGPLGEFMASETPIFSLGPDLTMGCPPTAIEGIFRILGLEGSGGESTFLPFANFSNRGYLDAPLWALELSPTGAAWERVALLRRKRARMAIKDRKVLRNTCILFKLKGSLRERAGGERVTEGGIAGDKLVKKGWLESSVGWCCYVYVVSSIP